MRVSRIKNFKRKKDLFIRFLVVFFVVGWVVSGGIKFGSWSWLKVENTLAYNDTVTGLSPTHRWLLDGNENDSVGSANSDGGVDPAWVSNIIPNGEAEECGDYNTAGYTQIPNQSTINTVTTYQKSISVWAEIDTADTSYNGRVIWGEGGSSNALVLYAYNNNIYFVVYESSSIDYINYAISTGTLYHIGVVLDAPNGDIYLYLNGELAASKTTGLNISTSFNAHSAGVAIGGYDSALKNHAGTTMTGNAKFDGRISDVAYWSEVVLDGDDFSAIYEAGTAETGGEVTVGSGGDQAVSLLISSTGQYVGGYFSVVNTTSTMSVTGVTITASGTIDMINDLDNIKLYYDLDTSTAYNCASESYTDGATQFGSTDTDGFSSTNTSTFTGNVIVSSTQSMCIYVVLDIGSGASVGETLDIAIANPSTDIILSSSTVAATSTVNISGVTEIDRISLVQEDENWGASSGTTVACTLSTAATAGNLLITALATDKNAGVYTLPDGFTIIHSATSTDVSGAWAYKIAAGGETEVSWSQTVANDMVCWLGEYDGLAASDVLDKTAVNVSTGAAVTSKSSGTTAETAQADELAIAFFTGDTWSNIDGSRAFTNGFTEEVFYYGEEDYPPPVIIATKIVTSTGAQETTFSVSDTGDQMHGFIATFKIAGAAETLGATVSATGTQVTSLEIPTGGEHIGGAFVIENTSSTANVTSITIAEEGTVDATNDLDNIKLYYDLDTSEPYDCVGENYSGGSVQYGDTDLDGFSAGNTSTFTGSVAVSSTQTMCVYTILDVGNSASADETIEIQINNPSADVVLSGGVTVSPESAVSIDGTTTLSAPPNLKQAHARWRNDDGYESDFEVGDGADGNLILSDDFNLNTESSGETYPDGVAYRVGNISGAEITLRNAAGSTLDNTNGIAAGDEILVFNLQGYEGDYVDAGKLEFFEVASVSGGVITISEEPSKNFDGSGNSYENQKVVVQRVPNYINVTTNAYDITASAWDGLLDHDDSSCTDNVHTGVVVFRSKGVTTVSNGGSINTDALGYRGGAGITAASGPDYAYQGEFTTGTGQGLQEANWGGGGGGYNDLIGASHSGASGGGGGYGTAGEAGDDSPEDAGSGGDAGGAYGYANLSRIFFGSGGGGGGSDNDGVGHPGEDGGIGGGIIIILARYLDVVGTISADGGAGGDSESQYAGSGGGGAGGSVYIAAASSTLGSGLVTATGGAGGCGDPSRCGGDGGSGIIRIAMTNYTGTTSPEASVGTTPVGGVVSSTWAFAEDAAYTDMPFATTKRIRFLVNNDGTDSGSLTYHLEYAKHANCAEGSYAAVPTDDSADWKMSASSYIADGEATIDIADGLSNPTNQHWVNGTMHDATGTSTAVSLGLEHFTEIEFAVEAVSGQATTGSQYCFRLTTPSETITYTNYAIANMATSSGGSLSADIVDGDGVSIVDPFAILATSSFSFSFQSVTGTLGTAVQKIRVSNQSASAPWTLTMAASSTEAVWTGLADYYDFNDPTASAGDGEDDDIFGGQMTIDPTTATITPQDGCSLTGLTLGSAASFTETTSTVTLVSASGEADVDCYWDFTDIAITQTVPAEQAADSYSLDMVITITAI